MSSGLNLLGIQIGGGRGTSPRKGGDDKKEKKEKKDKKEGKEKKEKKDKKGKTHPTHPHPLNYVIPGYEPGWRCDLCKKEGKGIPIWHCEPCSYDVCDGCMNQSQSTRGLDSALPHAIVANNSMAAIRPSTATFEEMDPTRSSQGFLETFALSASRCDALSLATPGTEDAYFYAGLQLLHSTNGTGGTQWKKFYARYISVFGTTGRARELDWRAKFVRFDAGMMEKEEAKEFLASIAEQMNYSVERDDTPAHKIVNTNSFFRQWYKNDSIWQPKERRGLNWPSSSPSPPTSASYPIVLTDKKHGADADMYAGEFPTYLRAYVDGVRDLRPWGGSSSHSGPSLSLCADSNLSSFFYATNLDTLPAAVYDDMWNRYRHVSQPNFYKLFLHILDREWTSSAQRVTAFIAKQNVDRKGDSKEPQQSTKSMNEAQKKTYESEHTRWLEDHKNIEERRERELSSFKASEENQKSNRVSNMLNQKRALFLKVHLDALLDHPVYGDYAKNRSEYVSMYVEKLLPNADLPTDWVDVDLQTKLAFYANVFVLVNKLMEKKTNLGYFTCEAVIEYHILQAEMANDIWNWDRFRKFIALYRNDSDIQNSSWIYDCSRKAVPCHGMHITPYQPKLPCPSHSEIKEMVKAYLERHFEAHPDVTDVAEWTQFLNENWVKSILAVSKLYSAVDKPAKWLEMISNDPVAPYVPSGMVQQLQDRVDLDLAKTNRKYYTDPETAVSCSIHTKNIRQLVVKVFEINTEAFYKSSREEITTDINLDGLAANVEQVYKYEDASPLMRVLRTFNFPELGTARGVFVIEFIAAGKSSRAVIRRGGFRFIERVSVAGQVLTILDEKNQVVKGVKVLVDSNEYTDASPGAKDAAPTGEVVIPFSTSPNPRRAIVIQKGDYACLDYFSHQDENYNLATGFVVEREQLIKDSNAQILVRTALYLNNQPIPLAVLEDITLTVTTRDKEGVSNTKVMKDFTLHDDRESSYTFRVPDDLRSLNLQLTAKVTQESSGSGAKAQLSGQWSCNVNQSDDNTDLPRQRHLRTTGDGKYEIVLTGKTGEPVPFFTTSVYTQNAFFTSQLSEYMSSDANGVIQLGNLRNISTVKLGDMNHTWSIGPLSSGLLSLPAALHGKATNNGVVCVAPYLSSEALVSPPLDQVVATALSKLSAPHRSQAQLFSLAADAQTYIADLSDSCLRFDANRGLLNVVNLQPGDYELYYTRQDHKCRIRVASVKYAPAEPKEGEPMVGQSFVLGERRFLENAQTIPVLCTRAQLLKKADLPQSALDAWERNMASLRTADEDAVRVAANGQDKNSEWLFIQLSALTPSTRVHILNTEFMPLYNAYDALNVTSVPELTTISMSNRVSQYLDGRVLGEEYRYVLDRKLAARKLGNMNRQPTLLLNPWSLQATDTAVQSAASGTSFASMSANAKRDAAIGGRAARTVSSQTDPYSLDFIGDAATFLSNIRPSGRSYSLAVPRAALGSGGLVRIFVVDGLRVHTRATMIPHLRSPKLDNAPTDSKDTSRWKDQQKSSKDLQKGLNHRDLRLLPLAALPPKSHFVERRATDAIVPGKQLVVSDITSATLGLYDSVAKMHSLFTALGPNAHLQSFAFVSRWGGMTEVEKSSMYSQYACHELHFFLYRKDESFFRRVVRPHITQKLEKQLMDYWLLSATEGSDDPRSINNDGLRQYLEPARFECLNYLERILLYHRAHRCGIWPWPGPTGGIVQHLKDLRTRAQKEGRTVTEADDPILFKNTLSCGGLDPDAIKAALAAAGAIPQQQAQPPPPPPVSEEIEMPCEEEAEEGQKEQSYAAECSVEMDDCEVEAPKRSMSSSANRGPMPSASAAPSMSRSPSARGGSRDMEKEKRREAPSKKLAQKEEKHEEEKRSRKQSSARPSLDVVQKQAVVGKAAQVQTDLARRGNVQQAFKQLEKTQEWAESQYWQMQPKKLNEQSYVAWEAQRCAMSAFWIAVAEQVEGDRNFLELAPAGSERVASFLTATFPTAGRGNFADQMFAMALVDLSFAPPQLNIQFAPSRVVITAPKAMIAFYRDLGDAPAVNTTASGVTVEQYFFDPLFRTQTNYDTNENLPYRIVKEFQFEKVYGCQVKVNGQPGCKSQKVDIMTQIPVGALPIGQTGFYTKSHMLHVSSGSSQTIEYLFYFPAIGQYPHYPAHVSAGNQLVAFAEPFTLNVVKMLAPNPTVPQPPVDKTTWEYISQCGSVDEVFDFLDKNGPINYNLDLIMFRCKESNEDFWKRTAAFLRKRHLVNEHLLAWAFHYWHPEGIAEYLSHPVIVQSRRGGFYSYIAVPFTSKMFKKDENTQNLYQHLEYAPLVNARAHTLGQVRKILNSKFAGQYSEFLQLIARKPQPDATDYMAACYYLLLQDRTDDARRMCERVAVLPIAYSHAGGKPVPLSKNGEPQIAPGAQKRDLGALLAAAPTNAIIGPDAPVHSPRYFATQIQYDYMAAYLDFLDERYRLSGAVPPIASEMCGKYKNYPVSRWASRFQDMDEQVKEIAALSSAVAASLSAPSSTSAKADLQAEVSKDDNKPDPERMRVLLAKMWQRTRPSFDMSLQTKSIVVDYANVANIQMRFYIMDLELLFSTQPFFVTERSGSGSGPASGDKKQNSMFIKPNITSDIALPVPAEALLAAAAASGANAPIQSHSIAIPEKIADSNLIIEAVVPGGIRKTLTYFANSLLLSVQPSVGQLQVLERPATANAPSRPIAGAYVKVYAKLNSGGEPFWKDLYTDLRGRADYCSLSDAAADLGEVKSFSILVVTDKNGSVIREVAPPGL